jgi:predicted SAM-dependent methyltransferase
MPPSAEDGSVAAPTIGEAAPEQQALKIVLHVGCGYPAPQRLHPRFRGAEWREVRLDIDPIVQPDLVCSMTEMTPVGDESVDAVWSSHNLEHLYRHEVPIALREFLRVLRPQGVLLMTLPDLQQIAELVVTDRLETESYVSPSGPVTPLDMIFGHTASLARGHAHMAHRCGFTPSTLGRLLVQAGFADIRLRRGSSFDIWVSAHKPAG